MIYRNDLDAAHARIESLERDKRELAEENARLRGTEARTIDTREVHPATVWSVAIFGIFTAVIAGAVVAGY